MIQNNKKHTRELLTDAYLSFRLRELNWKMSELKQRYISLSLFRSNQEKYLKLLNSLKTRRAFIQDVLKSKLTNVDTVGEMLEETMTNAANQQQMASGGTGVNSPQMSSTVAAAANSNLIQSPSKSSNGENQFVHMLNQFLISTLRRLSNELNRLSASDEDEIALKSQISTSFNINLDTFIDLADKIRSRFASSSTLLFNANNSKSYELAFNSSFDSISKAICYIYDQVRIFSYVYYYF